jgi:hypothetical protein
LIGLFGVTVEEEAMYCTPAETRTARKPHRCTNCAEVIEAGTQYQRWMSVDDGKAKTNTMHPECLAALVDDCGSGYFEYTLYGGERPEPVTPNLELTGRAAARREGSR